MVTIFFNHKEVVAWPAFGLDQVSGVGPGRGPSEPSALPRPWGGTSPSVTDSEGIIQALIALHNRLKEKEWYSYEANCEGNQGDFNL